MSIHFPEDSLFASAPLCVSVKSRFVRPAVSRMLMLSAAPMKLSWLPVLPVQFSPKPNIPASWKWVGKRGTASIL